MREKAESKKEAKKVKRDTKERKKRTSRPTTKNKGNMAHTQKSGLHGHKHQFHSDKVTEVGVGTLRLIALASFFTGTSSSRCIPATRSASMALTIDSPPPPRILNSAPPGTPPIRIIPPLPFPVAPFWGARGKEEEGVVLDGLAFFGLNSSADFGGGRLNEWSCSSRRVDWACGCCGCGLMTLEGDGIRAPFAEEEPLVFRGGRVIPSVTPPDVPCEDERSWLCVTEPAPGEESSRLRVVEADFQTLVAVAGLAPDSGPDVLPTAPDV